jgi:hypothetical protein
MSSHHPMTEEELARIQRLCDGATKGPWEACVEGRDFLGGSNVVQMADGVLEILGTEMDLDFIASARQDVVHLLEEVKRLRGRPGMAPDVAVRQPMTDEELDLVQRLSDEATAGPWTVRIEERGPSGSRLIRTTREDLDIVGATDADLDFIANAREDVSRLLHEVTTLRPSRGQGAATAQPALPLSNLGRRWIALGEALGFRVIAPARVEFSPRRVLHIDAFVVGFGAPRGMLLVTDFEVVREFVGRIDASGYSFATLSDPGTTDLEDEDLDRALEMLDEWVWARDPTTEPPCLRQKRLSERSNLGHEWTALGEKLGFQVIAPAKFRVGWAVVDANVLLPHFGGPRGMLLVTDSSQIGTHGERLEYAGYGVATVADPVAPEITEAKLDSAIRLLRDWGWSGVSDMPGWLRKEEP